MAKTRDIRKVQFYILLTIVALVGGAFAAVRITQRKRARKVDKNIDLALQDPNLQIDDKGDIIGPPPPPGGGPGLALPIANSKAKALVDDIWGFTITIKHNIWQELMGFDNDDFKKIVMAANSYVATKPAPTIGSKPRNFYQLVDWETSARLNSGAITSRISQLGLN